MDNLRYLAVCVFRPINAVDIEVSRHLDGDVTVIGHVTGTDGSRHIIKWTGKAEEWAEALSTAFD